MNLLTQQVMQKRWQNWRRIFDKKVNKIYARWKLTNEKQQTGKSLDSFQLRLMIIAKDCGFGIVTAVEYKNETVHQSFVSGLEDSYVRQRILVMDIIFLEEALEKAVTCHSFGKTCFSCGKLNHWANSCKKLVTLS